MLVKRSGSWFLSIALRRDIAPHRADGVMAYDINEKSIDALLVKPGKAEYIHIDISGAKHIHKMYQEIRERKRRLRKGGLLGE